VAVGVGRPGADRDGTAAVPALRERRDDDGEGGELLGRGFALDDPQQRAGLLTHSGMFPCFLGGRVCRLFASTRSALVTWIRVCDGGMTAST
jgi:hypothetical protein